MKTIVNEFTLAEAKTKGRIAFCSYIREVPQDKDVTVEETYNAINWYPEGKKKVIFFAKSIANTSVADLKGNLENYKVLEFDDCSLKLVANNEIEL
jgi:hypothetical protein